MKLNRTKYFSHPTIVHHPPIAHELQVSHKDGKRYYQLPDGNWVPSITTVLGHFKKKSLEEWRNRVGESKAKSISTRAGNRGSKIHEMVERYIKNQPMDIVTENANLLDIQSFKTLVPALHEISRIHFQEKVLWSKSLGVAGRVDLIAEYKGELSVIDFKTSLKEKREEWIEDYFIQATAYALMHEHLYVVSPQNKGIKQIVVIISNDESPVPQIFVKSITPYIIPLISKIALFREHEMESKA